MIAHYFKIAFRNLIKYKTQSVISILGLAIGITFFIFGIHWLRYETSYDSFYPAADRSYYIYYQTEGSNWGSSPAIMATYLRQLFPEIENVTCSFDDSGVNYIFDNQMIQKPEFMIVDSSFIHIFPQKILLGTTLKHENEIIISESLARKFWKNPQDAIGTVIRQEGQKGIYLSDPLQLHIVGITEDAPENTSFQYVGYYLYQPKDENPDIYNEEKWTFASAYIHFTLKNNSQYDSFVQHLFSSLQQMDFLKEHKYKVIPVSDKHFEFASEESFSYSSIRMFAAASLLLLCCVLFNFLNLCLNRYYQRSREMKLRKSVGANSHKLIQQLVTEAMLNFVIAFLLCGCLLELFIPFFEQTFSISILRETIWAECFTVSILIFMTMIVILIFPMVHFIHLSTKHSLIGKPHTRRHNLFRRVSLSIQLIACLFFFASTVTLYQQLRFMRQTDMGFDTKNIIELSVGSREQNGADMLEEIKRLPMIQTGITSSSYIVSKNPRSLNPGIEWDGQSEEDRKMLFAQFQLSKDGDKLFNFRLLQGRTFNDEDWISNENSPKDAVTGSSVLNKVLINQTAAKQMKMENPVGQIIRIPIGIFGDNGFQTYYTDYEIIGVIKDFHSQGMKSEVYPTLISQSFRFIQPLNYFQITPGTEQSAIKAINALAQKYHWEYSGYNTEPRSIENRCEELNKSETATFQLFSILAFLCILISLFGIFSISSSTIAQRRKEIAIRKVMGATVSEIIGLFFREYTSLVCIAGIIAFPFSYYVMSNWLEQYAYHIHINPSVFIIILGTTIILVLLTVLQRVIQAANENPAEVIKNE